MKEYFDSIDIINALKDLDLSTCEPKMVHQLVAEMLPQTWFCHPLKAGTIISRCRKDPKELVRKEFLYKPVSNELDFKRASIPCSSVFYGAVGDDRHWEYGDFIAMLETSDIRRKNISTGREIIYVSHWRVREDIPMALIVHNEVFVDGLSMGASLNSMQKHYRRMLAEYPDQSKAKAIDKNVKFIAEEFAKNVNPGQNKQYMISAYFADMVLQGQTGGIIYPSVQAKGKLGFNVALKPCVVNEYLNFLGAKKYELFKYGDYMPVKADMFSDEQIALFLDVKDNKDIKNLKNY